MWVWLQKPMTRLHGICLFVAFAGGLFYSTGNSRDYVDRRLEESVAPVGEQLRGLDDSIQKVLDILRKAPQTVRQSQEQHIHVPEPTSELYRRLHERMAAINRGED